MANPIEHSYLAVIPAKAEPQRFPEEFTRQFAGKPLLAYAIEAAKRSGIFSNIIVSTDDPVIREVAIGCGAEAPFLRDKSLSGEDTPISLVTLDALVKMEERGSTFDAVCQLAPHCPLRTSGDILASISQFESAGAPAQISVIRFQHMTPWWAMKKGENHSLNPLFPEQIKCRSQDLPDLFFQTGAIWWIRPNVLRTEKTFHTHGRTGWEMPHWHAMEIRAPMDWKLAESVLIHGEPRKADGS